MLVPVRDLVRARWTGRDPYEGEQQGVGKMPAEERFIS